jgi:hypothetical protein
MGARGAVEKVRHNAIVCSMCKIEKLVGKRLRPLPVGRPTKTKRPSESTVNAD